ncbi:MAG: biotin/lipoyl-containing protein [Kiritimatiellia bacterium]
MITRITVPHLDANLIDVTVTAWRSAPGDRVQVGEIVAELTTDKATFELEATGSGTLLEILAAPKSVVPSGYILAVLGEPGEVDADAAGLNRALMTKYREGAGGRKTADRGQKTEGRDQRSEIRDQRSEDKTNSLPPAAAHLPPTAPAATRVRATPRARRLAQELGLDLAKIQAETGAEVIDESVLLAYKQKQ